MEIHVIDYFIQASIHSSYQHYYAIDQRIVLKFECLS